VSEIIKLVTQSPWSHAALYIGRLANIQNLVLREKVRDLYQIAEDEQLLVEGVLGKGTVITRLTHYRGDHIRICRPKGISLRDAHVVIEFTIGKLGSEYAIRHNFDLARFLLPWRILPRRWLSCLFTRRAGSSTKEICSSMLAEAFSTVKFPILPIITQDKIKGVQLYHRNPRLFTPRDFDYSPYFEIIKYPVFELSSIPPYRDLPWSEQQTFGWEDNKVDTAIADTPTVATDKTAAQLETSSITPSATGQIEEIKTQHPVSKNLHSANTKPAISTIAAQEAGDEGRRSTKLDKHKSR